MSTSKSTIVTDLESGVVLLEKYTRAGRLHREPNDGPALIKRAPTGQILEYSYCLKGQWHREDGPAHATFDASGAILEEAYSRDGYLHRDPKEGPAFTSRNVHGVVLHEHYIFHMEYYRDPADGPNFIRRDDSGILIEERYSKPGDQLPGRPQRRRRTRKLTLPEP